MVKSSFFFFFYLVKSGQQQFNGKFHKTNFRGYIPQVKFGVINGKFQK